MKPDIEQMTLFDFLGNEVELIEDKSPVPTPTESPVVEISTVEISLPGRKSVLEFEPVPKEFDGIKIGSVCEIVVEDPRKEKLPHLYTETQIGQRIVVTELSQDRGTRWVWAYRVQLQRILSPEEKRSKRLEYDPRCSVAPYQVERLKFIM